MRYEWDENKDAQNRMKHGLSMADGIPSLEDEDRVVMIDGRFDYGEVRFITLRLNARRVLTVVTTIRQTDLTRIISVRKANKNEVERYNQSNNLD